MEKLVTVTLPGRTFTAKLIGGETDPVTGFQVAVVEHDDGEIEKVPAESIEPIR